MDQRFSPGDLFKSDKQPQAPPQPTPVPQPDNSEQLGIVYPDNQGQPQSAYPAAYDFIVNSPQQPLKRPMISGGGSLTGRLVFAVGGLTLLIVGYLLLKNVLLAGPDFSSYFGIAQDQQALIALTDATTASRPGLTAGTLNFIATANPSIKSSQKVILKYMADGGTKTKLTELGLRIDKKDTKLLDEAATNNTLDTAYKTLMQTKIQKYMNDLKSVYNTATGKNGKALLDNDYSQAELLLEQLGQ